MSEYVSTFELKWSPVLQDCGEKLWTDKPKDFPIEGVTYIPNFLSLDEATELVNTLDSKPYEKVILRKQQFWGPTYYHTTQDIKSIQPEEGKEGGKSLNFDELHKWVGMLYDMEKTKNVEVFNLDGSNRPDQGLVNEYVGNMGIASHFDDFDAFGDVLVMISLVNPVTMTLQKPKEINNHCDDLLSNVRILLEPGSLLVLKDESRYQWRHGITRHKLVFLPDGSVRKRDDTYRRLSLTIRKLGEGRKRIQSNKTSWMNPDTKTKIPVKQTYEEKENIKGA